MNRAELLAQFSEPRKVLDKGHVRLVDVMGDDWAVVQAARVSYGKGLGEHDAEVIPNSKFGDLRCKICRKEFANDTPDPVTGHCKPSDRNLIRYLLRHKHGTPLEMCEIKLHIRMPMDSHRQQIRHRTASVNEFSTRYSEVHLVEHDEDGMRIIGMAQTDPAEWRLQSQSSKQGSSGEYLDVEHGKALTEREQLFLEHAHSIYRERLDVGVAKELARKDLPLSCYTEYYWKMDLRNLLGYLALRMDPHAQYEIRQYANVIWDIVQAWVPFVAEAFVDYVLEAHTFSRQEMMLIKQVFADYVETCEALYESEAEFAGATFDKRKMMKDRATAFNLGSSRERKAFWTAVGVL